MRERKGDLFICIKDLAHGIMGTDGSKIFWAGQYTGDSDKN